MRRMDRLSRKGLYRSRQGVVFGVCRGLAEYFDFSVFWARAIALVLLFVTGLWPVVMPVSRESFTRLRPYVTKGSIVGLSVGWDSTSSDAPLIELLIRDLRQREFLQVGRKTTVLVL